MTATAEPTTKRRRSKKAEPETTITEVLGNVPQLVDAVALAVRFAATTDTISRPVLGCVAIRDRWAYAADGFMLARADLPLMGSYEPPEGAQIVKGTALIPGPLAARIAKDALPLKPKHALQNVAWFGEAGDDGSQRVRWRDVVADNDVNLNVLGLTFPDAEKIIPTETSPIERIALSHMLLAQAAKIAKAFTADEKDYALSAAMKWEFGGPHAAAKATITRKDGRECVIVVMPMVIGAGPW